MPSHCKLPTRDTMGQTEDPLSPLHNANQQTMANEIAQRKLKLACFFSSLFMVFEFFGGYFADSLSIMTDAAHLLSDVSGFLISLLAIYVSTSFPVSDKMTYGYQRAEVVGAVVNVLIIWSLTCCLVYAAILRFYAIVIGNTNIHQVDGKLMFIIACAGLCINVVLMKVLGHGHSHSHGGSHGHSHGDNQGHSEKEHHAHGHAKKKGRRSLQKVQYSDVHDEVAVTDLNSSNLTSISVDPMPSLPCENSSKKIVNLNIEAAYIHALGDFIQSLGVCLAGALIWYKPSWQIVDPIVTMIFSVFVFGTTYNLMRDCVLILMEGTPSSLNLGEVRENILSIPNVVSIHDLHVWSLSAGLTSLSLHVVFKSNYADEVHRAVQEYLSSIEINHSTIQMEKDEFFSSESCLNETFCARKPLTRRKCTHDEPNTIINM